MPMASFVLSLSRRRCLFLVHLPSSRLSSACRTIASAVLLVDAGKRGNLCRFAVTPPWRRLFFVVLLPSAHQSSGYCATFSAAPFADDGEREVVSRKGRWLTLPPFSPSVNIAALGEDLARGRRPGEPDMASTTALKWIRRCCPYLPVNLVQKLFRLRQVRREMANSSSSACLEHKSPPRLMKRISGKEALNFGDLIHLPITVENFLQEKKDFSLTKEEVDYVHSLEILKDESIIVVNKPSGLPVQGGVGIKLSMDMLAGACLRYDYKEPPRLVHRLDRESSGVLVLGRTQTSTSLLHSIFREKTLGAFNEMGTEGRILRKKYWALVFGKPMHSRGLITAPLKKVNLESRKYEHIMLADHDGQMTSQHAVTEYEVVDSSCGFTWLELCPLTGRKHQLRVHCAEALGTPIVGDLKYGWSSHRKWQPWRHPAVEQDCSTREVKNLGALLLGVDLAGKSILEQHPSLHLHCRQMNIPNVSLALRQQLDGAPAITAADGDRSKVKCLELVAPLPPHMQRSWEALAFQAWLR